MRRRVPKPVTQVRPSQYRRLWTFAVLLLVAFGGLGYRLVEIQVIRHEELLAKATRSRERVQWKAPKRGQIYDARRQLLATTVPVKTVCADPRLVEEQLEPLAKALAPVLDMPWERLAAMMERRVVVDEEGVSRDLKRGVTLKHKVDLKDWERVMEIAREYKLKPKAIYTERMDGERRIYPNGALAAHVLGFTGESSQDNEPGAVLVGKSGIEASLNDVLTGTRGVREVIQSARANELVALRPLDVAPRSGMGVVLTLDAGIQHIVETEIESAFSKHSPISVTCIVVRPRTGEILAMANMPTFDPNRPGDSPVANWRNRAITDLAEPGSTFKALVVAGALQEGVVRLETPINCEKGIWSYRGQRLRDDHSYELLTVENVVAKSSNIGAAKIGLLLGEQRLHHYMRAFGMGEPTRILLGGELRGTVHPLKNWSKISVAWIPMGHEVAATPLQMAMAISAIANGGRLMRPMLVKALVDEESGRVTEFEPMVVRQVVDEKAAREVTQALKSVVISGTGKRARLEFYEVAGKTGTAQKLVNGAYSRKHHFSSFIGFFPADNPELCISVVMDEPKKGMYGSETAAPVWKRVAERTASYLGISPTQGLESPMFTGPALPSQNSF